MDDVSKMVKKERAPSLNEYNIHQQFMDEFIQKLSERFLYSTQTQSRLIKASKEIWTPSHQNPY
jgi:hypothetical protein